VRNDIRMTESLRAPPEYRCWKFSEKQE
jgi:Uncharacterized conserved protein